MSKNSAPGVGAPGSGEETASAAQTESPLLSERDWAEFDTIATAATHGDLRKSDCHRIIRLDPHRND